MTKKGASEPVTFAVRDTVLGKIRGFPPWPGMIVDPDSAPPLVLKERPAGKKSSFYLVRFFPVGDFSWLPPKEIQPLSTLQIQSYIDEPYKKSGDLLEGYKIALNPEKWEEEKERSLNDAQEAEANADIDQLDSDEGAEDGEDDKKTKKRKRVSETKTKTKEKAKAKPVIRKAAGKGKKGGKSKETVESEDDGDAPPKKKAKPYDIEDDENAKKVREWRHRLQKAFLSSNKSTPKEEDMPAMDTLFTEIESYEKMTVEYLSFSKIGKVMRHIAALEPAKVPLDSQYNFRERAKGLVDKWHVILNADGEKKDAKDASKDDEAKPNGNGDTASANKENADDGLKAVETETKNLDLNGTSNGKENGTATEDVKMGEA